MTQIVLATYNRGKAREFQELLPHHEVLTIEDLGVSPAIEEDGLSFEQNALIKALAVAEYTDLPVLADDSGLEVDALAGAPGIFSARFAGEPSNDERNMDLLRYKLRSFSPPHTARFVCALAYVETGHEPIVVRGTCEGEIIDAPRGTGGFGYDPIFLCAGQTFAEMDEARKNRISHRARAIEALEAQWAGRDSRCE